MIKFVEHRVADRRILSLIQKWLKAGVMEEGKWSDTETGTPIRPLLKQADRLKVLLIEVSSLAGSSYTSW
jgi:hypothetical protein